MSPDILLHDAAGLPSPRRVRFCLAEKGLSWRSRWLNLALMDQKRPDFLQLNPTGQVPVMVIDGAVICDSHAINEYLDTLYPQPRLVPEDPLARARMREWFAFEGDFAKPFREASYQLGGKARLQRLELTPEALRKEIRARTPNPAYERFAQQINATPPDMALVADLLLILFEKMTGLERALEDGRDWVLGSEFSLADIALAPRTDLFPALGAKDFDRRFPAIAAWMARTRARPAWAASDLVPQGDEPVTLALA